MLDRVKCLLSIVDMSFACWKSYNAYCTLLPVCLRLFSGYSISYTESCTLCNLYSSMPFVIRIYHTFVSHILCGIVLFIVCTLRNVSCILYVASCVLSIVWCISPPWRLYIYIVCCIVSFVYSWILVCALHAVYCVVCVADVFCLFVIYYKSYIVYCIMLFVRCRF